MKVSVRHRIDMVSSYARPCGKTNTNNRVYAAATHGLCTGSPRYTLNISYADDNVAGYFGMREVGLCPVFRTRITTCFAHRVQAGHVFVP